MCIISLLYGSAAMSLWTLLGLNPEGLLYRKAYHICNMQQHNCNTEILCILCSLMISQSTKQIRRIMAALPIAIKVLTSCVLNVCLLT